MRRYVCTLLALGMLGSASAAAATEGVVLPAKGDTCKSRKMDADHAREESEWKCPGPNGFGLGYFDSVMNAGITIQIRGRDFSHDSLQWAPAKSGLTSRVEWRLRDGQPVAAIVGRWRRIVDPEAVAPEVEVEELLIVKISPAGACAIGVMGASKPEAMEIARQIVERRAFSFRCGADKAFATTDTKLDATSAADARLAAVEILDHNGSLVELKRSRAGTIEIRYREPRAALTVPPGTLLFRGAEHNGRVSGEAFVFKAGCAPASYAVTGRRESGTLSLSGQAPRRGKGCAIAAMSAASPHAFLAFEHEPVVPASMAMPVEDRKTVSEVDAEMIRQQ